MLANLFLLFFRLGFFSFGGGYSMIPLIEQSLLSIDIALPAETIANLIAVAGTAPGPVGVNLAVAFGFELSGLLGAGVATLGVITASFLVITTVARLFQRLKTSRWFGYALEGIRPVVVGVVVYAGINLAAKSGVAFSTLTAALPFSIFFGSFAFHIPSLIVCSAAFFLLLKTKLHPIILLLLGGIAGCLFF